MSPADPNRPCTAGCGETRRSAFGTNTSRNGRRYRRSRCRACAAKARARDRDVVEVRPPTFPPEQWERRVKPTPTERMAVRQAAGLLRKGWARTRAGKRGVQPKPAPDDVLRKVARGKRWGRLAHWAMDLAREMEVGEMT